MCPTIRMPYYVIYRRGDEEARAVEGLDKVLAAATPLTVSQMEAAIKALEGICDPPDWTVKRPKATKPPFEWRIDDLLLVKVLVDWRPGSVLVVQKGHVARIFESRHLGLYYLMDSYLATCSALETYLATWLGVAKDALPSDVLTYLLERRGLALHWIEERVRNQIDYQIVPLKRW
jgi:hypothetical protein